MKTSELTGAALDWAVEQIDKPVWWHGKTYQPSTNWAQGGPIIEREKIDIGPYRGAWRAARHVSTTPIYGYGPTPLIAAMQCYVASVLGEDVELPEGL